MLIRHSDSVTGHEVDMEGAKGVIFRMLLGEGEGAPNFCMRQFNIAPGGHTHDWEHEFRNTGTERRWENGETP